MIARIKSISYRAKNNSKTETYKCESFTKETDLHHLFGLYGNAFLPARVCVCVCACVQACVCLWSEQHKTRDDHFILDDTASIIRVRFQF